MRETGKDVTPEFTEVIKTHVDAALMELNVCMPAKVVTYYPKTQTADVKPQLLIKYEDGSVIALPVLPGVPVKHPRSAGGKARIHMPLAAGDDLVLVFSQRSLDNWKIQGGLTDPADRRKFHLSDAVALIGGSAEPDAFAVQDATAIEMVNDETTMQVFPNGTFNVKNGSTDLMSNLVSMADTLSTASTVMGGPFVPGVVATLESIKANLQSLEGN